MVIRNVARSRGIDPENPGVPRAGSTGGGASSDKSGLATSPAAKRAGVHSKIKDPKLATGIALVVLSMVLGSWIISSADQRSEVWMLKEPLAAGSVLGADDLVATAVNLGDIGSYASTEDSLEGMRLTRDIGPHELIPQTAVSNSTLERRLVTIPVGLQHGAAAAVRGDKVDVHVSEKDAAGGIRPSKVILTSAVIAEINREETDNGDIPVVLDVDPTQVPALVGALRGGVLDIVRVTGGQS